MILNAKCTQLEAQLFEKYPALAPSKKDIEGILYVMLETYRNGGKLLLCGNGGSCADCDHIVGELMKSFRLKRTPDLSFRDKLSKYFGDDTDKAFSSLQNAVPAISLCSQSAVMTAYNNDVCPEFVYAQLCFGYGKQGDTLMCLSTSGNSENVVNAARVAKAIGLKCVSITGQKQSKLSEICDFTVKTPSDVTFEVQEYTLPVYHFLCAALEIILFDNSEDSI